MIAVAKGLCGPLASNAFYVYSTCRGLCNFDAASSVENVLKVKFTDKFCPHHSITIAFCIMEHMRFLELRLIIMTFDKLSAFC